MDNEIRLIIDAQSLRAEYGPVYSGSAGILKVRLIEADFPQGLVKALRFRSENGKEYYTAQIIDNKAVVPHEVIEPPGFSIALAGYDMDGEEVLRFYPTASVNIRVSRNGYGRPEDEELSESGQTSVFGYIIAQISGIIDRLAGAVKSISDHRAAAILDHPDGSVTTQKIAGAAVTREKLGADVTEELDAKAEKATTLAGYGIADAYTKAQTDVLLDAKADMDSVYTKSESDGLLDAKVDKEDGKRLSAVVDAVIMGAEEIFWNVGSVEKNDEFKSLQITKTDGTNEAADFYNREQINGKLAKKANRATTLAGYGIGDAYTKDEVDGMVSSVYRVCGSVAYLPDNAAVGDVYNVLENSSAIGYSLAVNVPYAVFEGSNEISINLSKCTDEEKTIMMRAGVGTVFDVGSYGEQCTITGVYVYGSSVLVDPVPEADGYITRVYLPDIEVKAGDNVVWTDCGWDKLSASVDLSAYATKEDLEGRTDYSYVDNNLNYLYGEIEKKADEASLKKLQYYGDADIEITDEAYFTYTNNGDGTCAITGLTDTGKATVTDMVIPYEINGSAPKLDFSAFAGNTKLKTVVVPGNMGLVPSVFSGCTNLVSVSLNGIGTAPPYAFAGCSKLTTVKTNGIIAVSLGAFRWCESLKSLHITENVTQVDEEVFDGCTSLTITCSQGSYIDTYAKENGIPVKYDMVEAEALLRYDNHIAALAELAGDYVIEPVMHGLTEQLVFKRFSAAEKYQVFAGETPLTDSAVSIGTPTVTAAQGFEGDNITVRLFSSDDALLCTAKLNTKTIGSIKTGRLERILH